MKKHLGLPFALLGIVLLAGFILWNLRPPVTVRLALPWQDGYILSVVGEAADSFESSHGKVRVEITGMEVGRLNDLWKGENPGKSFDIAVATSPAIVRALPPEDRASWTGVTWSLYYNKSLLSRSGWTEGPPEIFLRGSAELEDLESLLADLESRGVIPLTVGGRYLWPLGALLQHMILSRDSGTDPAVWDGKTPLPSSFEEGWERYLLWQERGWVNEDVLERDWPASVLDVMGGKAAFVLIPSSLSSTIPPEGKEEIGLIPFPSGEGERWTVGSNWSLAVPSDSANSGQARRLLAYLTEEETSEFLQERLGLPFYSREGPSSGTLYTSVSGDGKSPFMVWLADQNSSRASSR